MIAERLDTPSRVSLALTCRFLRALCFPLNLELNKEEKQTLLLLLEKDTSKHYFCHFCNKLHAWNMKRSRPRPNFILEDSRCKPMIEGSRLFLDSSVCRMKYNYARLIMNRHFYGPEHGLPLRDFQRKRDRRSRECGISGTVTSSCRIVDDKLLILRVNNLQGDRVGLSRYFRRYQEKFCIHIYPEIEYRAYVPRVQLPELEVERKTKDFVPCHQSFRSCSICLTDYSIEITRRPKGNYNIKLLVYNQLGECRSPHDWNWKIMTSLWTTQKAGRRANFPLEYAPGSIVDRWNKGDGIESKTESTWVEIPDNFPWNRRL